MEPQEKIEILRRELRESVGNRAQTTFFFFDELRSQIGQPEALKLLKRALYRQGHSAGLQFRAKMPGRRIPTPDEFAAMANKLSADEGRLFPLNIHCASADRCDAKVTACPAKDALLTTGLNPADFEAVTQAMDAWTYGMMEGIGFGYFSEPPKWGAEGCCFMHVLVAGHPDVDDARSRHPLEGNPLRQTTNVPL